MAISIRMFEIAMKTLGVRRQKYVLNEGSMLSVKINNTRFIYIDYGNVIYDGEKISNELKQLIKKELGKEYFYAYDFECNRIYTLRGLLTLITICMENYTKAFVDKIINETYKELLRYNLFLDNQHSVIEGMHSENMLKLFELLVEYDNLINPFGNSSVKLREPIEYLNSITMNINYGIKEKDAKLLISKDGDTVSTSFSVNAKECNYCFRNESRNKQNGTRKVITFSHIFKFANADRNNEELIMLNESMFTLGGPLGGKRITSISISMTTGMAWKNVEGEKAKLVTEKQLEFIIGYLIDCINTMKKEIISKMVL